MASTQDTLQVLVSMGLRLTWDERRQIARVESQDEEKKSEDSEEDTASIIAYIKNLEKCAQQVSERHLVSSLLAGPDNETDDAVDVPVFLGSLPATSGDVAWVVQKLGLKEDHGSSAMVTVRETVEVGADASTAQARGPKPWVVRRLLAGATEAHSVQGSEDADADALATLLGEMRPRLSFELALPDFPTRPVCILVGLLPSPLLPHRTLWGGLISYRVSS